ncbi:hypothetical protein C453_00650 [Haloferax elongans ATCC BAA-1513]|uniref:Phage tail assembly protein n=1 Tax=Haloferax elongans ATCC BAA-1513 TaxID=1230453 RepID=M0HY83_HALEO|nr:hypothetical protein [Haloferax elongans]ELZ89540.1 hypothetical protein C453_00650 [Haloferax elongans ATCC BAA-1513]
MTNQTLQTEFEFTLPKGYVDDEGTLHKEGRMRLATAADEIQPLNNPRVQSNSSYLTIVLLARTVTELGSLDTVDENVIQSLFVSDLEYLQVMYERVNNSGLNAVDTACPECGEPFTVEVETGAHVTDATDDGIATTEPDVSLDDSDGVRDISTVSEAPQEENEPIAEDAEPGNPAE